MFPLLLCPRLPDYAASVLFNFSVFRFREINMCIKRMLIYVYFLDSILKSSLVLYHLKWPWSISKSIFLCIILFNWKFFLAERNYIFYYKTWYRQLRNFCFMSVIVYSDFKYFFLNVALLGHYLLMKVYQM